MLITSQRWFNENVIVDCNRTKTWILMRRVATLFCCCTTKWVPIQITITVVYKRLTSASCVYLLIGSQWTGGSYSWAQRFYALGVHLNPLTLTRVLAVDIIAKASWETEVILFVITSDTWEVCMRDGTYDRLSFRTLIDLTRVCLTIGKLNMISYWASAWLVHRLVPGINNLK